MNNWEETVLRKISSSKNGILLSKLSSDLEISRTWIKKFLRNQNKMKIYEDRTKNGLRYFTENNFWLSSADKIFDDGMKEHKIKVPIKEREKLIEIMREYQKKRKEGKYHKVTLEQLGKELKNDPRIKRIVDNIEKNQKV